MILSEKMNERIRFLRIQHGYTQQYISDILGVGKSAYSMYESGERNISVEIITKLAKLYNVSKDFIIGLSNNTGSNNSSVESHLSGEAVRAIMIMSNSENKKALAALNATLSDRECCKLFTSLFKVLYMPSHPIDYLRREFPKLEAQARVFLKDLFGLSEMACEDSSGIIELVASEIGISTKCLTKEAHNVAKMLFMAQIENFIERHREDKTSYSMNKNRFLRGE